jgi:cyclic pyranopterin phosphate synthase
VTKLTHLDATGAAHMVDVSDKPVSVREAQARGKIELSEATLELLYSGSLPKGDALAVARIAAIQAVKKTPDLIPLCHPLMISKVSVEFERQSGAVALAVRVCCSGQTGVEMEALTGVSVGLLALYDMVKGVQKDARISAIELLRKTGGKSGDYHAATGKD